MKLNDDQMEDMTCFLSLIKENIFKWKPTCEVGSEKLR